MYDEFGPWIAHQPGLGVSGGAPDEVLGQLILLARAYSNNGTPVENPRGGVSFPLGKFAGISSWGTLNRNSPIMAQVIFSGAGTSLIKNVRDRGGYSPDMANAEQLGLVPGLSFLGSAVRRILSAA